MNKEIKQPKHCDRCGAERGTDHGYEFTPKKRNGDEIEVTRYLCKACYDIMTSLSSYRHPKVRHFIGDIKEIADMEALDTEVNDFIQGLTATRVKVSSSVSVTTIIEQEMESAGGVMVVGEQGQVNVKVIQMGLPFVLIKVEWYE